jgi:hypothetical protein
MHSREVKVAVSLWRGTLLLKGLLKLARNIIIMGNCIALSKGVKLLGLLLAGSTDQQRMAGQNGLG